MYKFLALFVVVVGCPSPPSPPVVPAPAASPRKLTITNQCNQTVWIQQQGHTGSPAIVALAPKASATYPIPDEGLASTRYWPKTGCDASGNNCKLGQSSPPCPAEGCAPPVDSKLEATWGCTLPKEQCAVTPQGHHIGNTFWNSSAVDGYTLPYDVKVTATSNTCTEVSCAELDIQQCPTDENLPPAFSHVDLHVRAPSDGGPSVDEGCFAPCQGLGYPGFGGKGIQPPSDPRVAMYCCPTPPVSPAQCSAGPVVGTKYVKAVHAMCHNTAYAYAYDDGLGLRQCDPKVEVTMTLCPPVPATP